MYLEVRIIYNGNTERVSCITSVFVRIVNDSELVEESYEWHSSI